MAETIGALSVDLRLFSAKFEQGIGSANKKLDSLSRQAQSTNRFLGTLLAAGSGVAFTHIIQSSLDAANRLGDLSNRLGTTVEGLSRLEYAAELTGVKTQTLTTGLQRMTRRISEAAQGTGEGIKAIQELGLSAEKLNKLRPEQQFEVLADALEGVPNQADKVRLAMKLLDSEGVALLQTMKGGSAAIREMAAESDRTGRTISKEFAESATAANEAIIGLKGAISGATNIMVAKLAPTLEETADWLTSVLPGAIEATRQGFQTLGAGVLEATSMMLAPLEGFYDLLEELPGSLGETYSSAKKEIQAIRETLEGGAGVIYEEMLQNEQSSRQFTVALRETNLELDNYVGKTLTVTEKLKEQRDVAREAQKALNLRIADDQKDQDPMITRIKAHERGLAIISDIEAEAAKDRNSMLTGTQKETLGYTGQFFGNLADIAKEGGEKSFRQYKALASIQAAISAALAITNALATPPAPLGIALAGTVAAAAAIQIGKIQNMQYSGARAVGGPVAGGGTYLVGEKGPELLTMGPQRGHITPNNQIGSQGIQVTNVFQVSTGVQQTVQAEIARMMPNIAEITQRSVRAAIADGGSMSRAVGRRS